jgi:hypothetical protein
MNEPEGKNQLFAVTAMHYCNLVYYAQFCYTECHYAEGRGISFNGPLCGLLICI